MHDGTGWLPQIGTDSICVFGKPYYLLAWEMASQHPGWGNSTAQYGYDCGAGYGLYDVCGKMPEVNVPLLGKAVEVRAGQTVTASVSFTGPFGSDSSEREFRVSLKVGSKLYASGTIVTNEGVPVPLGNIVREGGVMVEEGNNGSSFVYGLAKFSGNLNVQGAVFSNQARGNFDYFKWPMGSCNVPGCQGRAYLNALSVTRNVPFETTYNYSDSWRP